MDPLYTILTNLVTIVGVLLVTRLICLCLLVIHGVLKAFDETCDTVSSKLVENIKFQPSNYNFLQIWRYLKQSIYWKEHYDVLLPFR